MKNLSTYLLAGTVLFLGAVLTDSCNNDKVVDEAVPDNSVTEITAIKLLADYEADEAAANKLYKGKTLVVSGKVLGVDKKHDGSVTVKLNSPESSIGSVRCEFKTGQADAAGKLAWRDETVIKGVCTGFDVVQVVLDNASVATDEAVAANFTGKPSEHPNNKKAIAAIEENEEISHTLISDSDILYVSVTNDGSKKDKLAQQLCAILRKYNATTKHVKVIEADTASPDNPDNALGILLGEAHCD